MTERLRTIVGHLHNTDQTKNINPQLTFAAQSQHGDNFKYTLKSRRLSREQRQFYEENGFIVIKKLVSEDKLQKYRERFEQICKREVEVPMLTIMRDIAIAKSEFVPGQKAVTKIQDFQLDDDLFEYCALPEVVDVVEAIIGENIIAIHTMLINKPPDPGKKTSRHPMHQDLHYFPMKPPEKIVCSWTAMQKVDRSNGCLVVIPGSHKGTLLQHKYPKWEGGVNKMYFGIGEYDPSMPRTHLEMESGDTVFFHPLLIHGSGMNKTNDFRKSISCHYAASDIEFEEVESQSEISDEVVELASRRTKIPKEYIKFMDVWRIKSRLVKGTNYW